MPAEAVRRAAGGCCGSWPAPVPSTSRAPGPETSRTEGPEVEADLGLLRRAAAAGMVLVHNPARHAALALAPCAGWP